MPVNARDFFATCQEPELLDFRYENRVARFVVQLYDTDEVVKIKADTRHLYSNFIDRHYHGAVFTPFLEHLGDCLAVENRVYVPDPDFIGFMKEIKFHFNLAYGLRASQYQKMVRFSGAFDIALILEGELVVETSTSLP